MAYGSGGFRGSRGGGFRGGFRRSFHDGPREMHKIKCSECGKDAEVPFKPRNDTPVYCRDCFMKRKGITPREPRAQVSEKPAKKEDFESESDEESGEESEESEGSEEEY